MPLAQLPISIGNLSATFCLLMHPAASLTLYSRLTMSSVREIDHYLTMILDVLVLVDFACLSFSLPHCTDPDKGSLQALMFQVPISNIGTFQRGPDHINVSLSFLYLLRTEWLAKQFRLVRRLSIRRRVY
jgi:hypothetical protein